jgi:hypothetical protein
MRSIVGILLLLLGVGTLSCNVQGSTNEIPNSPATMKWVRTADGWEHPGSWNIAPVGPPTLHPLVVAAGQSLASVLALVAFHRDDS